MTNEEDTMTGTTLTIVATRPEARIVTADLHLAPIHPGWFVARETTEEDTDGDN